MREVGNQLQSVLQSFPLSVGTAKLINLVLSSFMACVNMPLKYSRKIRFAGCESSSKTIRKMRESLLGVMISAARIFLILRAKEVSLDMQKVFSAILKCYRK